MKTFLVVGSLLLFLTAVQTQPLSSSIPAGQDLVFQAGSPGLAELEDVPLGGSLTVSIAFKTGANNGQLLYMKEASVNHTISLYLEHGALHLQLQPGTLMILTSKETGEKILFNDNQWHEVLVVLTKVGGSLKYVQLKADEVSEDDNVQTLPLLDDAKYETFIGGLSASEETRNSYIG